MSNIAQTLITRREYNFATVSASSALSIVAVRAVDATAGKRAELVVRVHAASFNGAGEIRIHAVPISISPEEPQTDFNADSVAICVIDAGTTVPSVVLRSVSSPWGAMLQIRVEGIRSAAPLEVIKATISVDLVWRE